MESTEAMWSQLRQCGVNRGNVESTEAMWSQLRQCGVNEIAQASKWQQEDLNQSSLRGNHIINLSHKYCLMSRK